MKAGISLLLTVIIIGCSTERSSEVQAKTRYAQMKVMMDRDLRGLPFDEFMSKAGIDDSAVFDVLYTNKPHSSRRAYHFEGFALDVSFEERDGKLSSDSHFFPALHWDGLTRQQRMAKYQKGLSEYFLSGSGDWSKVRNASN